MLLTVGRDASSRPTHTQLLFLCGGCKATGVQGHVLRERGGSAVALVTGAVTSGHVATRGHQGWTSWENPLLEPQEELDPVDTSISELASRVQ